MTNSKPMYVNMSHLKHQHGYNDGWCPKCGKYINQSAVDNLKEFYCIKCGRKLKWRKEIQL